MKLQKLVGLKSVILHSGFLYILFVFLIPQIAWAWGDLGHQTIAEIAERHLSPKAKSFVFKILGVEPFAVAGVFPDMVRSDSRFEGFGSYHFIEIPVGVSPQALLPLQRPRKDAHVMISEVPKILQNSNVPIEQKLILLRYFIHIVGDVHQPEHVQNSFDRGANLCTVHWTDPESGSVSLANLHVVWDELLFDYFREDFLKASPPEVRLKKRSFGYKELTDKLLSKFESFSTEKKAEVEKQAALSPLEWYAESYELHSKVYPDSHSVNDPTERTYCKVIDKTTQRVNPGNFDGKKLPILGDFYSRNALLVIESQLLKGGLRLAHLLNQMSEHFESKQTDLDEKSILNALELTNDPRSPSSIKKTSKLK
jgi:hypothetical protein